MSIQLGGLVPSRLRENMQPKQEGVYRRFLVKLTEESLKKFIEGELERFDALVRDTGCHKRAVEVVEMARDPEMDGEITPVLKSVQEEGLKTEVSKRVHFLVLAYMLTLVKRVDGKGNESTQPLELKMIEKGLSKKQCERFVEGSQQKLADLSVEFLRAAVVDASLREKLVIKVCECPKGRPRAVMPCYFEFKAVLNRSNRLLLIVGQLRLFYRDGERQKAEKGPVLAIKVISVCKEQTEFLDQLEKVDLRKVLLANGAKHPQFAGVQRDDPVDDEEVKKMAGLETLFVIDHIFATIIREEE